MASSVHSPDPARDSVRDWEWSTGIAREVGPLDDWIGMICAKMVEVGVQSRIDDTFAARWKRYGVGAADLNFLQASPQNVVRSPEMTSRAKSSTFELLLMQRGPCFVDHGGDKLLVDEGHFVLLDDHKTFDLQFPRGSVCHAVHLEESWLRRWIPNPHAAIAKSVSGRDGWGHPLAALLCQIERDGIRDDVISRSVMGDQLGALTALLFSNVSDPARTRHTASLFERATRIMRDRFDDDTLTPAALAGELGISKRYVHTLFAQAGTTFGQCLSDIRLTRAADMLASARYRAYRICDIAWACGFSDPAYFARQFRQRFGTAPLEHRRNEGVSPYEDR